MAKFSMSRRTAAIDTVLAGQLRVGLARDAEGNNEEDDISYARQPGTMTKAMWGSDGPFSANDELVEYPPFFADAAAPLTHWFLAAADGERVIVEALDRPVLPVRGERLYFAPGTLVVTWPEDQT